MRKTKHSGETEAAPTSPETTAETRPFELFLRELRGENDSNPSNQYGTLLVLDPEKTKRISSLKLNYGYDDEMAEKADHYLRLEFGAAIVSVNSASIPSFAPRLYSERQDKSQKADAFLREVWADWLGKGLYQHTLRRLDPALMVALDNQYRGKREELLEMLPRKSAEVTARLGDDSASASTAERKKRLDAARMGVR